MRIAFKTKNSFISLYALLITLAISLSALHTLRTLTIKQDITLMLYFQKQSLLYAKTLHDIALQCYKQYDSKDCKKDSIQFDPHFYGEYIFHSATIKEGKPQIDKKSASARYCDILTNTIKHSPIAICETLYFRVKKGSV